MAAYDEDFPVGSKVRIVDAASLREFQRTWKHHHKLDPSQLANADDVAEVEGVSFYHGGDVLYKLKGVGGIWHEPCLARDEIVAPRLAPDEIKEHDAIFQQAALIAKQELITQEKQPASALTPMVRSKLDLATGLLGRVVDMNPRNWSAMWLLGKIQQRLGDHSRAFGWFVRAYAINPSHADVAREASICAMALGRSKEAISWAHAALRAQPSNGGLRTNLAVACLLAGNIVGAKAIIDRVMADGKADAVSQSVARIVNHFVASGKTPPTTTAALEDYANRHGGF